MRVLYVVSILNIGLIIFSDWSYYLLRYGFIVVLILWILDFMWCKNVNCNSEMYI